jgi:HD-GYP domain-containing protein (c-di-GMP phosphodiesterase class II)
MAQSAPPVRASLGERLADAWFAIVGPGGWRSIAGPAAFAIASIVLLVYDHLNRKVTELIFWLTLALIVSVFLRVIGTIRKQSGELEQQSHDALWDQVTGLQNNRMLRADIEVVAATPGERRMLMLLELDGLQAYNDRFGYEAGNELLRDTAQALVNAVTPRGGAAYRGDGGRLAALVPAGDGQLGEILLAATASLRGDDRDLLISRSYGEVTIPEEAQSPEPALQLAGRRLTAQKQSQHRSARRQAHAVLVAALCARQPELRDHLRVVAYRAIGLARRLGVDREGIDDIALAAELHDAGLLVLPEPDVGRDSSLGEDVGPSPSHCVAGEGIIAAAPGLASVARLVRASGERFDGRGYPDGLAGEAIPLGSRIIAVAVAFAALTSQRPFRPPLGVAEALGELRRRTGTQFDPRVVDALAAEIAEDAAPADFSVSAAH